MHRIDDAFATEDGRFTGGNPLAGIRATRVRADWLNDIQDNLMTVLAAAGVAPVKGRAEDLRDAILQLGAGLSLDAVSDLLALDGNSTVTPVVRVLGYYGPGTPGGGLFYLDPDDDSSAHNGGTILVDAAARRWKRVSLLVPNARWFGARGDGTTDDTAAINACLAAAAAAPGGARAFLPAGTYRISRQGTLFGTLGYAIRFGGGRGLILEGDGAASVLQCATYDDNIAVVGFDPATARGRMVFRNFKIAAPEPSANAGQGPIAWCVGASDRSANTGRLDALELDGMIVDGVAAIVNGMGCKELLDRGNNFFRIKGSQPYPTTFNEGFNCQNARYFAWNWERVRIRAKVVMDGENTRAVAISGVANGGLTSVGHGVTSGAAMAIAASVALPGAVSFSAANVGAGKLTGLSGSIGHGALVMFTKGTTAPTGMIDGTQYRCGVIGPDVYLYDPSDTAAAFANDTTKAVAIGAGTGAGTHTLAALVNAGTRDLNVIRAVAATADTIWIGDGPYDYSLGLPVGPSQVDAAGDAVQYPNHGLTAGTPVVLGGVVPGGLTAGIIQYVRNPSADALQFAASPGGAVIDITSAGGAWKIYRVNPVLAAGVGDVTGTVFGPDDHAVYFLGDGFRDVDIDLDLPKKTTNSCVVFDYGNFAIGVQAAEIDFANNRLPLRDNTLADPVYLMAFPGTGARLTSGLLPYKAYWAVQDTDQFFALYNSEADAKARVNRVPLGTGGFGLIAFAPMGRGETVIRASDGTLDTAADTITLPVDLPAGWPVFIQDAPGTTPTRPNTGTPNLWASQWRAYLVPLGGGLHKLAGSANAAWLGTTLPINGAPAGDFVVRYAIDTADELTLWPVMERLRLHAKLAGSQVQHGVQFRGYGHCRKSLLDLEIDDNGVINAVNSTWTHGEHRVRVVARRCKEEALLYTVTGAQRVQGAIEVDGGGYRDWGYRNTNRDGLVLAAFAEHDIHGADLVSVSAADPIQPTNHSRSKRVRNTASPGAMPQDVRGGNLIGVTEWGNSWNPNQASSGVADPADGRHARGDWLWNPAPAPWAPLGRACYSGDGRALGLFQPGPRLPALVNYRFPADVTVASRAAPIYFDFPVDGIRFAEIWELALSIDDLGLYKWTTVVTVGGVSYLRIYLFNPTGSPILISLGSILSAWRRKRLHDNRVSATFDYPSVAAGTGLTTGAGTGDLAVSGAALGDLAQYRIARDTQGLIVAPFVQAAGNVRNRLQNFTAGLIDLANATVYAYLDSAATAQASRTIDVGLIAPGSGTEFTVSTVAGAQVGDFCAAAADIDLAGLILSARISAPNTATIRLQNETGAGIDPAAATYRVWWWEKDIV